jgi:hypothetical protein
VLATHFAIINSGVVKEAFEKTVIVLNATFALLAFAVFYFRYSKFNLLKDLEKECEETEREAEEVLKSSSIKLCEESVKRFRKRKHQVDTALLIQIYDRCTSLLAVHLADLKFRAKLAELLTSYQEALLTNSRKVSQSKLYNPLLKMQNDVQAALKTIENYRLNAQSEWNVKYERFSWWNKIKHAQGPDFRDFDNKILELKDISVKIKQKHGADIKKINQQYETLKATGNRRIKAAYERANEILLENKEVSLTANELLQKAYWCSTFSVSISLWSDFNQAGDIYDSLRSVNGNFADMSDSEIWWESLWMSSESLTGLASLAKGAYFEQLVANDTGGELFEHFNHKDTDIIIDGVAVQLKATDSVSYIESVDSGIPVITTSEVAGKTGMIDSGYSNEELTDSVDLALGGTVVDVADTTIDALLAGVGGLGVFASISGINHAQAKYDNGMNGEEALIEGLSVAVEGTAKGVVDAGELVSKAVMSRPSRFVGRTLLKGLKKLEKY